MATTTNYGWTTPDDTALVKDGASAIRTLGSSVDTTTKNLNPETTLGDIAYRSSTANVKTRLGLGTAGQVLTVNSGATAPEWKDAASGANWSLLNSGGTALTGAATITISGISAKDKIMIFFTGASSTDANSYIAVRLNGDTGSNYNSLGSMIVWNSSYSQNNGEGVSRTAAPWFLLSRQSTSAAGTSEGYLFLNGCNSSGLKLVHGVGAGNSGDEKREFHLGGYYSSSSAISSVSMFALSGTFDAGTVYVYTSA
jgi:hypothetical protein